MMLGHDCCTSDKAKDLLEAVALGRIEVVRPMRNYLRKAHSHTATLARMSVDMLSRLHVE
jgi:hypothetical protein